MAFQIIQDDLTGVSADAIVNVTNSGPETGQVTVTPAVDLDAKYIIHTAEPTWIDGNHGEREFVRNCYVESLKKAIDLGCESIAFPLIASDVYGFPKDEALQIAASVFSEFLIAEDISILLEGFDKEAIVPSGEVFDGLDAYIADNYVSGKSAEGYSSWGDSFRENYGGSSAPENGNLLGFTTRDAGSSDSLISLLEFKPNYRSLDDVIKSAAVNSETWQEKLFRVIDQKGLKDAEVYRRACVKKQNFSQIRKDRDYHPSKQTAIALALALEMNLIQAKDFLSRAGYAFSPSSLADVIVQYFIEMREFNIVYIDIVLNKYGQPGLGKN